MSTYTSINGLFSYSITNNTTYTLTSSDLDIIQDAFNRWDNIIQIDTTKYGNNHVITINISFNAMEFNILGGASNIYLSIYNNDRTWGNFIASSGDLTLNVNKMTTLVNTIHPSGKTRLYYVVLHEIGHILGIGPFWFEPEAPVTEYIEDGETKTYYTGTNALREYKNIFNKSGRSNFVGIPIEDDGGAGTADVHAEEGQNHYSNNDRYINGVFHPGLQHELMSGWLDSSDVDAPLSRVSLGFLEDLGYIVNYNLADVYIMSWLATPDANNLEQTYILGFLDVSGGNMINRNGNLSVLDGTMDVSGDVSFNSKLSVGGDISTNGVLYITGTGTSRIIGDLSVNGIINASDYAPNSIPASAIDGQVEATPNFSGDVNFQQNVDISDNLTVRNKVAIGSTTLPTATDTALHVTGDIDFSGNLLKNGTAFVSGATNLDGLSDAKVGGTNFTDSILLGNIPSGTIADASSNVGVGANVFTDLTSGKSNVGIGSSALKSLTTGSENIAIGADAGINLLDGTKNISIGHDAGPTSANSAIERTVAIGQSARPEKNDQIVLGGVFSNNYPEVLHPGQTVTRDHVVVNPQSVTANVAPIQATGEYIEFTVPLGYIGSTDFKYFCSVSAHNMIKNFTIAAYDTTKTDKTYYVKTTGTNDPYFLFSETSGGTAINDASTELTLYKGRTYRFIRDETGAGHPFNIGTAINVNAFNMKVISTGTGSPTTSNTYSNPYPLSVNGFVNIENNLRVTGSIQGSIRQW